MKTGIKIIISLCFLALIAGCGSSGRELKKQEMHSSLIKLKGMRIAVVGFDVYTETYGIQRIDSKVEEMLNTALLKTGYFNIVDRRHIKKVLEEQKFQYSGMVDAATAVKLGKILGAQAIVTGAVTEIGFSAVSFIVNIPSCRASIDIRVIDVETAKVITALTGEGRSSVTISGDVNTALRKKDSELWIGEALRNAVEDAARKITLNMANVL
jgi:curli biogenesis system outer membrane secretion channel CsgG